MNLEKLIAEYDNRVKGQKIAKLNRSLRNPAQPLQYICGTGTKAKGYMVPATGNLPTMRSSVIPNGNNVATVSNAARAKNLQAARRKAIKAAKNSVA